MPKAKAKTRGVTTAKRRKAIGTSSSGMMSSTSDQPSGSELGNNKIVPQAEFETEVVRTDHDDHPIPVISCQSTGLGLRIRSNMATSLNHLEENLTCYICTELFTEPIQLPCQHNFCRDCLQALVDSGPSAREQSNGIQNIDQTSLNDPNRKVQCPVCRKVMTLECDVKDLPSNFNLVNIVDTIREDGTQKSADMCSMCEGESPKPAVKGCVTCRVLYCQPCISSLHPMRGQLRNHIILDPGKYREATQDTVKNDDVTTQSDDVSTQSDEAGDVMCEEHGETVTMYCDTCDTLMCIVCMDTHCKHDIIRLKLAAERDKDHLTDKIDDMVLCITAVRKQLSEINEDEQDLKTQLQKQTAEVEAVYMKTLAALNLWRKDKLDLLQEKHDDWLNRYQEETTRLESTVKEITECIKACRSTLLLGNRTRLVQGTLTLKKRISNNLDSSTNVMEASTKSKTKIQEDVRDDPFHVEEIELSMSSRTYWAKHVTRPTFRFIHHSKSRCTTCMRITNGGQKLSLDKNPCGSWHPAVSDTSFQSGIIYWELDIQFDDDGGCGDNEVYTAGITNTPDNMYYVWYNSYSWGVSLVSEDKGYKYYCYHDGKGVCPCIPLLYNNTGRITIRHGFYLNCSQGTFSIIDCTNNRLLHTFKDIDLTKALYPVVTCNWLNGSVRLRTSDDINTVPKVVYEKCVNVE